MSVETSVSPQLHPVRDFFTGLVLTWLILGFLVGTVFSILMVSGASALIVGILVSIISIAGSIYAFIYFRRKGKRHLALGILVGFLFPFALLLIVFGGCVLFLNSMQI